MKSRLDSFLAAWLIGCLVRGGLGRIFEPCELANELLRLGAPEQQVSTWVCIAEHESTFNTSAVGPSNWDGSRDHGIFQINDRYWCSPPGSACGIDCRSLENDDIADDWKCAKRIFKATRLQEGDGFRAWAVYGPHCSGDTTAYTRECKLRSAYVNKLASYDQLATLHAFPVHHYLPSYGLRPVYSIPIRHVYSIPISHNFHTGWYSNVISNHHFYWGQR